MMHAGGWLEGGLTCSFEKLILDAELLQMQAAFLDPIDLSEDALGLDAMAEAGPGGHFFGTAHTLARYETAFYNPILSDGRNFETWRDSGSVDATRRANRLWKEALAAYQEPAMEETVRDQLGDFIERRKSEGGVEVY